MLCAGAIQSPHLLELSGVGQGALLQRVGVPVLHDLPAVGENLHDHLHTRMNYEVPDPNKLVLDDFRGVSVGTFVLRPRSRGHVHIVSRDAAQAPRMVANYLAHEDDRFDTVAALRMARTVMAQPAMQRRVAREDRPGPVARSDEARVVRA